MGVRPETFSNSSSRASTPQYEHLDDFNNLKDGCSSREKSSLPFRSTKSDYFPYNEQLELFQFASNVLQLEVGLEEVFSNTIAKIKTDLCPSACSIFYLNDKSDDMIEFRDNADSRSSSLRKVKRVDACFGVTMSKASTQHLTYLPQVSTSPYQQHYLLPRDEDNDLYESVVYISILNEFTKDRTPIALIEVSSRQVHAFDRQKQLYLRTIALILGKAIDNILDRKNKRKLELVGEFYHVLNDNESCYSECLKQIIEERIFEGLKCEGVCLYEFSPDDNKLQRRIDHGAPFKDEDIPLGTGFEGYAAQNKIDIFISDAENDKMFHRERVPCHIEHIKSILCIPITNKAGDLVGVISCYNKLDEKANRTSFTAEDKEKLIELGNLLPIFIILNKLEREKNKERKRAESISAMMNYMNMIKRNQNNPSEVVKLLIQVSDAVISIDRVSFFVIDDIRKELVCISSNTELIGIKFPIGAGIAGKVARDGKTINVKDAYSCANFNSEVDVQTGYKTKNMLAIPIRDHSNKVIAVMELLNKEGGNFDELDEEILGAFAEEVAPAIKHVIMEMNEYNGIVFKDNSALCRRDKFIGSTSSTESTADLVEAVPISSKRKKAQKKSIDASLQEFMDGHTFEDSNLSSWDFDVLKFSKHALLTLVEKMFLYYDLPILFDFEVETLRAFIQNVMEGYRGNAFHNFHHAVAVVHTAFLILAKGGVDEYLEDRDVFAVLFAALVHDLEHTGNNNDFEVKARTQLALKYNDASVLENHAVACAFKLAKRPDLNIFKNFTDEDFRYTRKAIINIVIKTDMIHHLDLMKTVVDITENSDSASHAFDINDEKSRSILSCLVVHASDLSNPTHSDFNVSKRWSIRICEEFSLQAKKERQMGLQVTPFMDNLKSEIEIAKLQCGFVNYVVLPLWKIVAALFPKVAHFEANCVRNAELWQHIIDGKQVSRDI